MIVLIALHYLGCGEPVALIEPVTRRIIGSSIALCAARLKALRGLSSCTGIIAGVSAGHGDMNSKFNSRS